MASYTKICSQCKLQKLLSDYYYQSGKPRAECKECSIKRDKIYRQNNREKKRFYEKSRKRKKACNQLKSKYGITLEEKESMGSSCEICGSSENLCVDHCHTSGKLRGILCKSCNLGIGNFKESIYNLYSAIVYVRNKCGTSEK